MTLQDGLRLVTPERLATIQARWSEIKACNEPGLFDSWDDEPEGWIDELLAAALSLADAAKALRRLAATEAMGGGPIDTRHATREALAAELQARGRFAEDVYRKLSCVEDGRRSAGSEGNDRKRMERMLTKCREIAEQALADPLGHNRLDLHRIRESALVGLHGNALASVRPVREQEGELGVIAYVEQADNSIRTVEMGEPECGVDFCDRCGDCIACQYHGDEEWCSAGSSWWVIYRESPRWDEAMAKLREQEGDDT